MPEGREEGKPQLVNVGNPESESLEVSTEFIVIIVCFVSYWAKSSTRSLPISSPWIHRVIIYSAVIALTLTLWYYLVRH